MASTISCWRGSGTSWPMSGNINSREPGIAAAVAVPPLGRTNLSINPWMTSAGRSSLRSAGVRSGLAMMAAVWRPVPAGRNDRSTLIWERRRCSDGSKWDPLKRANMSTERCAAVARFGVGIFASFGMIDGAIRPLLRSPVLDMIDVSDRTRCGCSIAMVCAIMPPIDIPTTCACSIPSASSRPMASLAISVIR